MESRLNAERVISRIAGLLSGELECLSAEEEPVVSVGTALSVKGLAEIICSGFVESETDCMVVEGVRWVCWGDWIISESHERIGWPEYALAWLNANLEDRRYSVRLPRRPLLLFRNFWFREAVICPMTRHRAVLYEDGILTTWKLETMA